MGKLDCLRDYNSIVKLRARFEKPPVRVVIDRNPLKFALVLVQASQKRKSK